MDEPKWRRHVFKKKGAAPTTLATNTAPNIRAWKPTSGKGCSTSRWKIREVSRARKKRRRCLLCDRGEVAQPCAKNVLSWSEFTGGVEHDAEAVGKWTKKEVHKVLRAMERAVGYKRPTTHDAACAVFGYAVNAAITDDPFEIKDPLSVGLALGCAAVGN
jgi:hypothetical protein